MTTRVLPGVDGILMIQEGGQFGLIGRIYVGYH